MEVKPGYKQTEVGVIPEEWEANGLGRFWSVTDCKHVTAQFVPQGFPLASIREVQSRFVDLTNAKQTTAHFYNLLIEGGRKPCPGDLILSRNATVGEVAQVAEWHPSFAMGQDVCLLRKKSADHSTEFLQSVFQSPVILNQLANLMVGSTFKRANVEQIRNFSVPMPSPPEQRAIATALSDVDGLLGGLDRLIAKKRDLKQAAMQQLLTSQTRLPGFHGEWEVKRLRAIVQTPVTDGPHLTPRFFDDGIPFLSVNNLVGNRIDLTDLRFISQQDHEVFSRKCKPQRDDILLGKAASVGKVAIVELDCEFNIWSPIALIRVSTDHAARFIYYQLQSADLISQITLLTNSSSQGNIGMGDIEKLTLKLPPLPEQTAIASVLTEMDGELAGLTQRREKTRALKQAMMQELLTGRTRLVSPEVAHA